MAKRAALAERRAAPLKTPTDLSANAVKNIAGELKALLADVFALYMKTKNFHWHASGPHFRSLHLMFDEQAAELFAMTDEIAERARKLGARSLHSIGEVGRLQRIKDNDAEYVTADDMLAELREDNQQLVKEMREAHELCDDAGDIATASLLENWVDQSEKRVWFLFEAGQRPKD